MKWSIERSNEIKERIAKDENLTKELSHSVNDVLKKHGIKLEGMSYVFEPRVFMMDSRVAGSIAIDGREAFVSSVIQSAVSRGFSSQIDWSKFKCLPQCGPMDRFNLDIFEKLRLVDKKTADNPVPIFDSAGFIKRIVENKQLLTELSDTIFVILEKHDIKLKKGEGCVFTPCVFETPIYAQKVAVVSKSDQSYGFGPQIFDSPESSSDIVFKPLPGIIDHKDWGVSIAGLPPYKWWWWIGIPAPEILRTLDIMRETRVRNESKVINK